MVLTLTILLVLSTVGMLGILGFKRYELATGRVLLSGVRPKMRSFFRQGFFWVEHVLPNLVEHEARRLWALCRVAVRIGAARALIAAEHGLERGLVALHRVTTHAPRAGGAASPFLREVAEHKKKLQEEREEE